LILLSSGRNQGTGSIISIHQFKRITGIKSEDGIQKKEGKEENFFHTKSFGSQFATEIIPNFNREVKPSKINKKLPNL
jgi:hypothetical protein